MWLCVWVEYFGRSMGGEERQKGRQEGLHGVVVV